jgi:AcrR family transcriptional regulator
LRRSLISAARELTIAHGWDGVRMADVAEAAGVSRQTVYNEFESKAGLAEALASEEIGTFVAMLREDLYAHGADIRPAATAAILRVLTTAAEDPLIKAVLTSSRGGADELLPYLTTRADLVLAAATAVLHEWAETFLPDTDEAVFAVAAESIVRLAVSHIVLPSAPADRTAAALADVMVRLLR